MIAVVVYFAAGVLLGLVHFLGLRHTIDRAVAGGWTARLVALHLGRFAATALALWWLARAGGVLVLATLAGFVIVRFAIARRGSG